MNEGGRQRDVGAFEQRAPTYETGWKGRLHRDIATRTALLAASTVQADEVGVLDVGCGTGLVLRELASRLPGVRRLDGIDPAAPMLEVARRETRDLVPTPGFELGTAEALPYDDGSFDLLVSATSFDHWTDQRAGLAECARVLSPGGAFVLVDLVSLWLLPSVVFGRHDRARTRPRLERLLRETGFSGPRWQRLYATVISAVVATR